MHTLVNRLLQFSKPNPPKLEPRSLSDLVEETVDFLNGTFLAKRIGVNLDLDDHTDANVDESQIKQVLLNVLLNSVEAMEKGGTLSISVIRSNGHVVVRVKDSGKGIDKRHMPHVFDPFYSTKEQGSGLGLSVVHSIVESHAGRISIDSRPGTGTTVSIKFPAYSQSNTNGGAHVTQAHTGSR